MRSLKESLKKEIRIGEKTALSFDELYLIDDICWKDKRDLIHKLGELEKSFVYDDEFTGALIRALIEKLKEDKWTKQELMNLKRNI